MNNDGITVVTTYDMPALNMGKRKKGKMLFERCHLGKGNDCGNRKCVSMGNKSGVMYH